MELKHSFFQGPVHVIRAKYARNEAPTSAELKSGREAVREGTTLDSSSLPRAFCLDVQLGLVPLKIAMDINSMRWLITIITMVSFQSVANVLHLLIPTTNSFGLNCRETAVRSY